MPEVRHHGFARDAAVVEGPEAAAYLQGQLSQDVVALAVGDSSWSWLLAPAGKVDALVRVARPGDERFVVDTDARWGDVVVNRLTRFKLRTRADVAATSFDVLAVRGDRPEGAALAALWSPVEEAVDLLDGPAPGRQLGDDEWEAERITAGVPAMGAELTERTIPAETGLVPLTVSFTKGCYTGQELVARIDSRGGHVARHLRLLRSERPLAAGSDLTAGGKVVGSVTSASPIGPVALGYVGRAVEPGATVLAGDIPVEVVALPSRG